MQFWLKWMLAVHRAVWFPLHWVTGLERRSVAMPVEFAPALVAAPAIEAIEGKTRATRKMASSS